MLNSIKYTNNGDIRIQLRMTKKFQIKVTVQDSGIGIDKDRLKGIYEMFSTQEKSNLILNKANLGLPICNEVVKILGNSELKIKNLEPKGCKISFFINDQSENEDALTSISSLNSAN